MVAFTSMPYQTHYLWITRDLSICCHVVDCTDCISPCDCNVGVHLKQIMGGVFRNEFKRNKAAWCSDRLFSSQQRMLMAKWAAAAWAVLRSKADLLKSAFLSTGFLLDKNGSEDHHIHLPGITNYAFRP